MTRTPHWSTAISRLNACTEAVTWARKQPSYATAWSRCPRADWLLWLLGRTATTEEDRKAIVLAACACARTALKFVPGNEKRPRHCIEVTEKWARGKATIDEVRAARSAAAYAAAYDAADAADAYAAADAADAAYAAAYAAADAADAAYAAAYAAADAADAAADAADAYAAADAAGRYSKKWERERAKALRTMAKLVRQKCKRPALPAAEE